MAKKLKKELEERLREVIKSKIRRLREAPVVAPDEEEDEDEFQQSEPSAPDLEQPADMGEPARPYMGEPAAEPSRAGFGSNPPTPPDAVPPTTPPEPSSPDVPAMDEPAADGAPEGGEEKIRQAKVRLFFDKLAANPTLMDLLKFRSPLEQAEAIHQFATLVGVPKSQVLPLLKQIKDTSLEPDTEPDAMERIRR